MLGSDAADGTMTKREVIDDILRLNPSAEPGFLADFELDDLRRYLDKLLWIQEPRGRETGLSASAFQAPRLRPEAVSLTDRPAPREEEELRRVTGKWMTHAEQGHEDTDGQDAGLSLLDLQRAEDEPDSQPVAQTAGGLDNWLF